MAKLLINMLNRDHSLSAFRFWVRGSKNVLQYHYLQTSLAVQWLRLWVSTAWGPGSITGWELRFHVPPGVTKKRKKTKKITVCIHYQPIVYNTVKPICPSSHYRWEDNTSLILRSLQYFSKEKSVFAWSFKFSIFFSFFCRMSCNFKGLFLSP